MGLTQQQLAERIGVAVQSVHRWEAGKVAPGADRLWDWMAAVGVQLRLDLSNSLSGPDT